MRELQSATLIKLKAGLFLILAVSSALLLWCELPNLKTAFFLIVTIWSFCRCYYFAFYVMQHYVDGNFRFAGLWALLRYFWQKR